MATVRRFSLLRAGALLLVSGLAAGCNPPCSSLCRKLLDCEGVETPRVGQEECEASCLVQERLYEDAWDDPVLRDKFRAHKRCLQDESCEDIADGVCYDEDLYVW
jgi:hypothetical protein